MRESAEVKFLRALCMKQQEALDRVIAVQFDKPVQGPPMTTTREPLVMPASDILSMDDAEFVRKQ